MRHIMFVFSILTVLNFESYAVAAEPAAFTKERQAMEIIKDYASFACGNVERTGENQSIEVTASANAELTGVVKRLADLGASGAVKYQKDEYRGVLQADLAKALATEGNCKVEVLKTMQDKLLPPSSTSITPAKKPSALQTFYNDIMLAGFKGKKPVNIGMSFSDFVRLYKSGPDWEEHEGVDDNKILIYSGVSEGTSFGYQFSFTKGTNRLQNFQASFSGITPSKKELNSQPDFMKRRKITDAVQEICNSQKTLLSRFSRELGTPAYKTRAVYGVSEPVYHFQDAVSADLRPDKYEYEATRVYLFAPDARGWIGAQWSIEKTSNTKLEETEENLLRPVGNGLACTLNLTIGDDTDDGIDYYNYNIDHVQFRRTNYKDFAR